LSVNFNIAVFCLPGIRVVQSLGGTRTDTIVQIAAAVPYMDIEMQSIARTAIRKLAMLEEKDYA